MARTVYSTGKGRLCPTCSAPVDQCRCKQVRAKQALAEQQAAAGGSLWVTLAGVWAAMGPWIHFAQWVRANENLVKLWQNLHKLLRPI